MMKGSSHERTLHQAADMIEYLSKELTYAERRIQMVLRVKDLEEPNESTGKEKS